MIALLEDSETERFIKILVEMGGALEEVAILFDLDPEPFRQPAKPNAEVPTSLPPKANTPFNNPVLRDWMFDPSRVSTSLPTQIGTIGHGLFETEDFDEFLKRSNIEPCEADSRIGVVVLGRES